MIPENKINAVANVLQVTFGVSEFEDIRQLTVGHSSALIFRIVVLGKPYLLRVITREDAMSDPTFYYACMKEGAAAGIAPKVLYAGTDDRISITDFINAKLFPFDIAKVKLPALLKELHSLPPFPFRLNYLDFVNGSIEKFRASNIIPGDMTDDLFRIYAHMMKIYPRNPEDQVGCHNDLKPENILFDGGRVWLVDWEAAFLNDRYFDLAMVANFVIREENDEDDFLRSYFGDELNDYHRARFFLMRQITHMSYFTFFMQFAAADGPIDPNIARPGFREFHDQVWVGKITLEGRDARFKYGLVHMEQLRHNFGLMRFPEAIEIVSDHHSH